MALPQAPWRYFRCDVTGVLSPEAFDVFAEATIAETGRRKGGLSLIMVRPDPESLESRSLEPARRLIADALLRTVRSTDMVGDHGSGSFVVLAPSALETGALRIVARLRENLPARVGVSYGIATLGEQGATLGQLILQAESVLGSADVPVGAAGELQSPPTSGSLKSIPSQWPDALEVTELVSAVPDELARLAASFERGEIEGVEIIAEPEPCPACLDAARDVYKPTLVPPLPLFGCTSAQGCRCGYRAPRFDPRRRPPPVPAHAFADLNVPNKLRNAAIFGAQPKSACRPDELALYLDTYPLLPIPADRPLSDGEVMYLSRPATRVWERAGTEAAAETGTSVPLAQPLADWVLHVPRAQKWAGDHVGYAEKLRLVLTNWRLLFLPAQPGTFSASGRIDSLLLADIVGIDQYRDALACRVGSRAARLILSVDEPLQIALCVVRAIRDLINAASERGI